MKHSDPQTLEALDRAWDPEQGPLGKLRDGEYDPALGERYIELLNSIEISEGEPLHPDFVKLTWFAPLFSEWQVERAVEFGADKRAVTNFTDRVRERIMELLGVP